MTAGGPEHTGQTLLSVLWALAGRRRADLRPARRRPRRCAAARSSCSRVTAAKVFLYDLSVLDSLRASGRCIGFGLLLLCGAFAWQRVRPRSR